MTDHPRVRGLIWLLYSYLCCLMAYLLSLIDLAHGSYLGVLSLAQLLIIASVAMAFRYLRGFQSPAKWIAVVPLLPLLFFFFDNWKRIANALS